MGAPASQPESARSRRKEQLWPWRLATILGAILLWDWAVSAGYLSARSFSDPRTVGAWMWGWHTSGESLPHLAFTLQGAALGYVLGLTLGSLVAVAFVFVPGVAPVFDPFMATLNGIPRIVLAPFLIMVFGLGLWSKVAVAAILVFFVTFFNIYGGLKSVDRSLINNVKVLGAPRWRMATDLYIPAIVSWAMSTLRIGVGFALIGAVVGEFVGSTRGVGWVIKGAGELGAPATLVGALITLGIVAGVMDRAFVLIERRFARWTIF